MRMVKKQNNQDSAEQFVTRKEFDELHSRVNHYLDILAKLMEDRYVSLKLIADMENQLKGLPAEPIGKFDQLLRKERFSVDTKGRLHVVGKNRQESSEGYDTTK